MEAFNGKVITWDAFHVHVVVGKLKVMTESMESRAPGTTDGRTDGVVFFRFQDGGRRHHTIEAGGEER